MRNSFIDYLKGVLIFLVVYGHVIQHVVFNGHGFWEDGLFKAIYMFHMPLFMGISGYLSYWGIARSRFLDFARDKALAYLFPIVIWSTLVKLGSVFLGEEVSFVRIPLAVLSEIKSGLWFLWALLGCLLITAAIRSLKGGKFWFVYALSFLVVLCLPEKGNLIKLKFMYPYFQVGCAIACFGDVKWLQSKKWFIFLLSLPFSVGCYFLWSRGTYVYNGGMLVTASNIPNVALRYIGGFSASVTAVVGLCLFYDWGGGKIAEAFLKFGRDSIYIYILQDVLFYFVARANYSMPSIQGFLPSVAICMVATSLIVISCWWGGVLLARHSVAAQIFFGKRYRPIKRQSEEYEISRS